MHILALTISLALVNPTLALRTAYLRPVHNNEVPNLLFRNRPITKQLSENTGHDPLLSRRGHSTSMSTLASSNSLSPLSVFGPGTNHQVDASARNSHEPYASAEGNEFSAVSSSREVHNAFTVLPPGAPKTSQSSARVENPTMDAKGSAKAQGRRVKFKSDTRLKGGDGKFTVHGPGHLQVVSEKFGLKTDAARQPKFMHKNLAAGEKEDIPIHPSSTLRGKIDANIRDSSMPKVKGKLDGTGRVTVKAKHA